MLWVVAVVVLSLVVLPVLVVRLVVESVVDELPRIEAVLKVVALLEDDLELVDDFLVVECPDSVTLVVLITDFVVVRECAVVVVVLVRGAFVAAQVES